MKKRRNKNTKIGGWPVISSAPAVQKQLRERIIETAKPVRFLFTHGSF